ncbi:Ig-like domain-containing protein, partial [uncultured Gimesia sp.]|uniref:Ig-like domain-containing protein n=1 Tax=uncultured Gimesia sp. TaxID=1678688 RepID=UPI0030D9CD50
DASGVTINGNQLDITPSAYNDLAVGESVVINYSYNVIDGEGGVVAQTASITINGVNDAPVAQDDTFLTDEDTVLMNGDVFADNGSGVDSDPDNGATFTVTGINEGVSVGTVGIPFSLASGATVTLTSGGVFEFNPNGQYDYLAVGESATESFTYTIDDGEGGTNTATVMITIDGVNDPVTAADDDATTDKNTSIVVDVRLDNGHGADSDPDNSDVLRVTHIAEGVEAPVVLVESNPEELDSGATITLNPDGTLTYDPNDAHNDLTLPTDKFTETFTYTITDDQGSTNTATVSIIVTGSNEPLMTSGLPDVTSDGLAEVIINLDNHFSDADPGDTISYSIASFPPTLVGGDPLPANFWANNIFISGNELHIQFSDYSNIQVRLPAEITVTAKSSDMVSPDVSSMFTLTPDPQTTAAVQLVARSTVSSDRDFITFQAEADFGSAVGRAQLALTNGLQDLEFSIYLQDFVDHPTFLLDFDGTRTIGDSNDDLALVQLIDNDSFDPVFVIYDKSLMNQDPNLVLDASTNTVSGIWQGLSSDMIDKLYAGELAIQIFKESGDSDTVGGEKIIVSPRVADAGQLPAGQTEFAVDERYYVEIWVSDQIIQSLIAQSGTVSGIGGSQLDITWDSNNIARAVRVSATDEASAFNGSSDNGSINNSAGVISNIRGLSLLPGIASDSGYARLGYVLVEAEGVTSDTNFEVRLSDSNDFVKRSIGNIDNSQVFLGGLSLTHTPAASPLHGTVGEPEGTTVDVVVVQEQTEIDQTGHVTELPSSITWIDEWSSFWAEIYVETSNNDSVENALVDLNYNTEFFTATEIEFGSDFTGSGNVVIDDSTGVVTSISGTAINSGTGNLGSALLARVKFESLEQDDVSIDFNDKFLGPHSLGLELSNVEIGLADGAEANIIVGDAPETDLWAMAYDVNDDDAINFSDLVILTSVYGQNVLDQNSPYVWALDADKSGTVNFSDLTSFISNYGVSKGGDQQVVYPENFLQRWYGQTDDLVGSSSIDDVMDEALAIWQDALGLEQPLDIQLVITDLGGTQLGAGQITAVDDEGRPVAGIVTLDDDAAGQGWYSEINTSAFGGTELEGGVSYTADSGSDAVGHYDLLTVLLHEIGHVAGFTETYAPFQSHIEVGVGGTLSFVGSGFEATLTDDGLHLDDTVHAGDIMNATLDPGVRKLPSVLDALILQTVHETATTGDFEILVGVNAPLMANLPAGEQLNTGAESLTALDSNIVLVSNDLSELTENGLPQVNLLLNHLNPSSSALNQVELDLSVLEGLSEELISDLQLNGLSIVDSREHSPSSDTDQTDSDFDLLGLTQEFDAGFDDVFSEWAGPIL